MKKYSEEVDYMKVNAVEPGKHYRVDFGNGTVLEGELTSIEYHTYDYGMNLEIVNANSVDEPIPISSLLALTVNVPSVGELTASCDNFERSKFEQRIGIEGYTIEYEDLEDIVKEHYAKKGLEVIGVDFDSHEVFLSFKK